jgi:hypothetical protein
MRRRIAITCSRVNNFRGIGLLHRWPLSDAFFFLGRTSRSHHLLQGVLKNWMTQAS